MSHAAQILCGLGTGLAGACLHLWLLHLSLRRVSQMTPKQAGARIARSVPLRLVALAPLLVVVARAGLLACGTYVIGSLLGRWLVGWYGLRPGKGSLAMEAELGLESDR